MLLDLIPKKALEELKKHPISKYYPDRFLLSFLFAKKLDVERSLKLIENNLVRKRKVTRRFVVYLQYNLTI
jgi:hypothetical protein